MLCNFILKNINHQSFNIWKKFLLSAKKDQKRPKPKIKMVLVWVLRDQKEPK